MIDAINLPPSVTVSPTVVGVSVLTADGATVEISLQRLRGLTALSPEEVVVRAQQLALDALEAAAASLGH
ncbi:MAG: hypothetical protein P4L73_01640 [Caulobacteraceae bacterium]|nr:hypothetical protein [Caulobacteraceae bacterium]